MNEYLFKLVTEERNRYRVNIDRIGQILESECNLCLRGDRSKDLQKILDALWEAKELVHHDTEYRRGGGRPCEMSYLCAVNKSVVSDDLAAVEAALRHCLEPAHQIGELKAAIQGAVLAATISLRKMPETSFTPAQIDQFQQEALENYVLNYKSIWSLT